MKFWTWYKSNKELFFLTILFIGAIFIFFKPWIHGFDPVGYYSWLRSAIIDGNLDVGNELDHYGFAGVMARTQTGYTLNPYNVGAALLWSPFFVITHFASLLLQAIGLSITTDGYAPQYIFAITLGSSIYGFAGLLLSYHVAQTLYNKASALLATVGVWLASSVLFYMFMHPSMSHANDIFANSLVIAVWFYTRHDRTPWGWFMLGASIGLATLVRQQNAVTVLIPAIEILLLFRRKQKQTWNSIILFGLMFVLGGLIVFSLQFYVWYRVYGSWLVINPYAAHHGLSGDFTFFQPRFFTILFSTERSLYFYAPIFFLGTLGLWPLYRRDSRLATYLLIIWILQVYIVATWPFPGGASFGRRLLLGTTPIYVLGLTALIQTLQDRGISLKILWSVGGFLIVWNFLLIAQYITNILPHTGAPESVWTLVLNQVRVISIVLERLDELLAIRFNL